MSEGNGTNGNGRWWKKPSFSVEDVYKMFAVLIAIAVFVGGPLITLVIVYKGVPAQIEQMASHLTSIDKRMAGVATKAQVQSVINQGNEIHAQQDGRIRALEHFARIAVQPSHERIMVYGPAFERWVKAQDAGVIAPREPYEWEKGGDPDDR